MRTDKKKQPKKIMDGTVIDEKLLMKAAKDYLVENKIIQREVINLSQIKSLPLSFLNIWKIEYLQCLDRIEKLQLDNNIIEKIQNLGHLTNIKWLDLSFNLITKIEGLESLVNLTDISLYNNRIEVLEGLGNCSKLNVFSIGNNKIKTFEEVISYFGRGMEKKTKFKYLQVLSVYGNPFTMKDGVKDQEYQNHMISHLPNLRYLDYVFIDEQKRKSPGVREIDEKFKTEDQAKYLIELKIEQEKEKSEMQEKRKKESAKMHLIDNLPEELVQQEELEKIHSMKGLDDETAKFSSKVKEVVQVIQKKIKQKNEEKLKDIEKFEMSIKHRELEAEKETELLLQDFEKDMKVAQRLLEGKSQGSNHKQETQKLLAKAQALRDSLLSTEIELVEDVQNNLKSFTNVLVDYSKAMEGILTGDSGYFKKIDDQIKQFGVKLEKISKEAVDNLARQQNNGQLEQQADSDLNAILDNKDMLPAIISSIKERLSEKRIRAETIIVQELCQRDVQNYIKLFNEGQYERNRNNIHNIKEIISEMTQRITNLVVEEEDDD